MDGAALYAAPDRGSDRRRNGTLDVNDPACGPAMRSRGRSASFTPWVPSVSVTRSTGRPNRAAFLPNARPTITPLTRFDFWHSKCCAVSANVLAARLENGRDCALARGVSDGRKFSPILEV